MSFWSTNGDITLANNPQVDAFGRLRVSEPVTLFDSKQLHDKSPLFWDEVLGGSADATTYNSGDASVTMTVDAAGEYIIRQTKQRFNYQPGKSQQLLFTGVIGDPVTNTEKKIGYFNTSSVAPYTANLDGIYIKQDGTTTYVCVSKNGTETAVAQNAWNLDVMDGTGPSGITIDWSKTQIMVIDFEWLGVGRVRVGFNINGITYIVHEFLHSNVLTAVYMSSPNHSVRYEIRSTGGTASMQHICSSVTSEGGEQSLGTLGYISTAGTHIDLTTENTLYAILGMRLKTDYLDITIKLLNIALQIQTASHQLEWVILFNPTVAGTFTYNGLDNSAAEVAIGTTANTVSGGTLIQGGFLESGGNRAGAAGSVSNEVINALRLGCQIDGTRDTIVLCARPIGGSTAVDVEGALYWRESI